MSVAKTIWTVSVDDFTKLVDAEIAARLSPFTDGNRSARIRFLYRLGHRLLCSSTPETVNVLIADWQRINAINAQQQVPAFPAGKEKGESAKSRRTTDSLDGFLGGSHREFDALLAQCAGVTH